LRERRPLGGGGGISERGGGGEKKGLNHVKTRTGLGTVEGDKFSKKNYSINM